MRETLTFRIAAVILAFDIVFAVIGSLAFVEFLGVSGPGARAQLLGFSAAAHIAKIALWLWLLNRQLQPVDEWLRAERAGAGEWTGPPLDEVASAAYGFSFRFASSFALLWGSVYLLHIGALFLGLPPAVAIEPLLAGAAILFAAATVLAAFPFALLWTEHLSAEARMRISISARARGAPIPSRRLSLRRRVLLLTLCFTLAPTFWVLSMSAAFAIHGTIEVETHIPPGRLRLLVSFFVAVALWAPICAWLLVRTLAVPIGTIGSAIRTIARKREAAGVGPIPIYQADEIGALAESANEMIVRLADELERRAAVAAENERLLRAAESALRVRERFLRVASHELRTPLTPLLLNLQFLEEEVRRSGVQEGVAERLDTSLRQVERLARLAEDLLEVSASEGGVVELRLEPVDLAELAAKVAASLEGEAARRGSSIRLQADGGALVPADRRRVERVVEGVLDNALKFGIGRPVDVRVIAGPESSRVVVRDYGVGISVEDQARVFDRFERAAGEEYYGGLGVGLYLARLVIEAHGGRVTLDSQPGEGTTVTLELPATPHRRRPAD